MSANGRPAESPTWTGNVLSADDVRRRLNGQREVRLSIQTVLTPLAIEELHRCNIRWTVEIEPESSAPTHAAFALERESALVASAVRAVQRDGLGLRRFELGHSTDCVRWALALADCVAREEISVALAFCDDPALACCVANKVAGVRAASVSSVDQARRAVLSLAPNFIAVEVPGRTFFELRQIIRLVALPTPCPQPLVQILAEVERRARR
jgi:hypothetical protein